MSTWRAAALALALLAPAGAAIADERGVVVVSGGEIGQPDASVALLDLASVTRAGDVVTASMAIVVLDPAAARVPGISYMVGRQRLSCSGRTTQMMHVDVYGEQGVKLTEFDRSDPAEPIVADTPWAHVLDQACRDAPVIPANASPFADMAEGVAAVRASVQAAGAVQSAYAPHRLVYLGQDRREDVSAAVYLDQAQVERDGEAQVRWVMYVHDRPRRGEADPVAYDLVQLSFACERRAARIRVRLAYGADGALLRQSVLLGPWVGARAGTVQAAQIGTACGTEPAGAPVFDSLNAAREHARTVGGLAA